MISVHPILNTRAASSSVARPGQCEPVRTRGHVIYCHKSVSLVQVSKVRAAPSEPHHRGRGELHQFTDIWHPAKFFKNVLKRSTNKSGSVEIAIYSSYDSRLSHPNRYSKAECIHLHCTLSITSPSTIHFLFWCIHTKRTGKPTLSLLLCKGTKHNLFENNTSIRHIGKNWDQICSICVFIWPF